MVPAGTSGGDLASSAARWMRHIVASPASRARPIRDGSLPSACLWVPVGGFVLGDGAQALIDMRACPATALDSQADKLMPSAENQAAPHGECGAAWFAPVVLLFQRWTRKPLKRPPSHLSWSQSTWPPPPLHWSRVTTPGYQP